MSSFVAHLTELLSAYCRLLLIGDTPVRHFPPASSRISLAFKFTMARSLQGSRTSPARAHQSTRPQRGPTAERLDGWDLVELAAEGEYSQVYRARPVGSALGCVAAHAVKRLKPSHEDDPSAVGCLRREARVGRAVSSPHVVPVLSAHTEDAPYYIVMPWLEGGTLAARLANRDAGPVNVTFALWVARQVAQALDAFDAAGWTHADVKPANIVVSASGHATLIDLGFARRPADQDRTVDPTVMGTPRYMAPEMLLSTLRRDIRSDLFSLGAVLYEMLSGRQPFEAPSAAALVTMHRQLAPVDLRELAPAVPTEVSQLVHAMIAKEPLRRPQTPRDVIRQLTTLEIAQLAEEYGRPATP
jgi:eukaryotic-like serine/threonine-protein kinase